MGESGALCVWIEDARASGLPRYWSETLDLSRRDRFRDGLRLKL